MCAVQLRFFLKVALFSLQIMMIVLLDMYLGLHLLLLVYLARTLTRNGVVLPGRTRNIAIRTVTVIMFTVLPPQPRHPLHAELLSLLMLMMVLVDLSLPHVLLFFDDETDAVEIAAAALHQKLKTLKKTLRSASCGRVRQVFFYKRESMWFIVLRCSTSR